MVLKSQQFVLYRYFHLNSNKNFFSNLTQLEFDRPEHYLEYIKAHNLAANTYDENYFRQRFTTERQLYELFMQKGGVPRIKHPYYFTLGKCDEWFYRKKGCFGCMAFFAAEFNPDDISFTFGDSVPTFMPAFQDGKEYRSQVYTIHEIADIIRRFGMPNQWNTFEEHGPENYIEVQIWSDEFYSFVSSQRTSFHNVPVAELASRMILANANIPKDALELPTATHYLEKCKGHIHWKWFCELLTRISPKDFCSDYVHGILHAYKCALMAFALAVELELKPKEFKTLVYAAFFHDVGRNYFLDGKKHGVISAKMIEHFVAPNEEVCWVELKDALARHDDRKVDDINPFLTWLRDIDSLDYIRLGLGYFRTQYLKTAAAKAMIRFSMELNITMYLDDQFIDKLIRG